MLKIKLVASGGGLGSSLEELCASCSIVTITGARRPTLMLHNDLSQPTTPLTHLGNQTFSQGSQRFQDMTGLFHIPQRPFGSHQTFPATVFAHHKWAHRPAPPPNTFPGPPSTSTTTMAYVPPALRKKAQGSAPNGASGTTAEAAGSHENLPSGTAPPGSIAGPTFSQADIHHHYWPPRFTDEDPSTNSMSLASTSTLNASAQAPDKLKYIMLFGGANRQVKASHPTWWR